MPTLISHSPQELTVLYGQLSDDEQHSVMSLIENFLSKKKSNISSPKPKDWQSFIQAAKNNQEELLRPEPENVARVLFSDYSE